MKRYHPGDAGYNDILQDLQGQSGIFDFQWNMGGELVLWANKNQIAAYAILVDDGIEQFEVRRDLRGQGQGSRMIQELKQDRPRLCLSGYDFSSRAAKFWRKVGLN